MDGPRSQSEKDTHHMISLMCGIKKKKKDINELIYKTERESQILKTKFWLPKGKGRGWIDGLRLANAHFCTWNG